MRDMGDVRAFAALSSSEDVRIASITNATLRVRLIAASCSPCSAILLPYTRFGANQQCPRSLPSSVEDARTGKRATGRRRISSPRARRSTTAFFGLALAEHVLQSDEDELVILGTVSSQWDVLIENLVEQNYEEHEGLIEKLMAAVEDARVDQALLDEGTDVMRKAVNCNTRPILIPFGRETADQVEILERISASVGKGPVHIDVTHGFRHLGMIGFLSAFMLERLHPNLKVEALWYGALDMMSGHGIAPVLKLDGLDHVRKWVDALARYDATGDYSVFAPLLVEDDVSPNNADHLERAAFNERAMNVSGAAQNLRAFLPTLETGLSGASAIFQSHLSARLDWCREMDVARQQRELALEYLQRRDYLRAALFGWEALITKECEGRLDWEGRRTASEQLGTRYASNPAFHTLRMIRNALAHGIPPRGRNARQHRRTLNDPEQLQNALNDAISELLP